METIISSENKFLTVPEAALLLRCSEISIYRYLRQGRMKSYQPGGRRGRHLISSDSIFEKISSERGASETCPCREDSRASHDDVGVIDDEWPMNNSEENQRQHFNSFTSGENNSRRRHSHGGKRPEWMQRREQLMIERN